MSTSFIGKVEIKAPKTTRPFNERNVFSIAPANTLLSSLQRKTIINNIQKLLAAPDEVFKVFYGDLITDFVEFVQVLPVNNEARLASIMDEALHRAYLALLEYRQDATEEFDPLMAYVIFSTALLFDVGCIVENRTVIICNKEGEFISSWNPHQGPMQLEQGYYRIKRTGGTTSWSSRRLTVFFASRITPAAGMDWIFQNPNAYNIWLSLLNYDREGGARFSVYLDRALDMLERYKLGSEFASMPISPDLINQTQGMEEAESFMDWLANAVKSGRITINSIDSLAFLVREGLLISTQILKQYGDAVSRDVSLEKILKQLKKLGVGEDKIETYTSTKLPVKKAASLFSKSAVDVESGADTTREFQSSYGGTLTGLLIHSIEVVGAQSGIVSPLAGYVRKMAQNMAMVSNSYPPIEKKEAQLTQQASAPSQPEPKAPPPPTPFNPNFG